MTTSSTKRQVRTGFRLRRGGGVALALIAALAASSCASKRDLQTTGSIPDDYRTRHPIMLAEVRHDLDVPVGAGETGLTAATRDLIRGFAQDYTTTSKSTMTVAIPVGAPNSAASHRLSGEIRQALASYGVKPQRIVTSTYASPSPEASAPVRLSFVAVKAVTEGCGQWPTDMFGRTLRDNENWENFGCASQQNLAAQISNPTDLVGPRGMSPIDAERRATVINTYRDGE
ncbi:CpaD family pilus assembly protein [Rhizobium sp. TRM95796]|uniref:CpaD family pilus assembly protein n=1 Tax=Rhizobium sp. TRM95796 TaxID=2979862 RepID=UPI0021E79B1B|nr:CpaD family pilus assembly lipoprotein [Rhizobium sp. TRM95796]MCV3768456.1 CpaD family pilus assembly lipoprotein [Rhizobium sp. TRM95796]